MSERLIPVETLINASHQDGTLRIAEFHDENLWDQYNKLVKHINVSRFKMGHAIDNMKKDPKDYDSWVRDGAMKDVSAFTKLAQDHYAKQCLTGDVYTDLCNMYNAIEDYVLSDPLADLGHNYEVLWLHIDKLGIAHKRLNRIVSTLLPDRINDLYRVLWNSEISS